MATIEAGMEIAVIRALRQLRMKNSTTSAARNPPRIRCSCTSLIERRIKRDWSRTISKRMSCGSIFLISSSLAPTRSTTSTVLVPDCLRINKETAFLPSRRESVRASSSPSSA